VKRSARQVSTTACKSATGAATVILAMGAGKQAAVGIHDWLAKLERRRLDRLREQLIERHRQRTTAAKAEEPGSPPSPVYNKDGAFPVAAGERMFVPALGGDKPDCACGRQARRTFEPIRQPRDLSDL
jgi:hypothetical protein